MTDSIDPIDFKPIEVTRPPYLHRYELFSPKLERRLTLFSWNAVLQWIMLESDAAIERFCERPCLVPVQADWQLADFWVLRKGQSEFLLLQDAPRLNPVGIALRIGSDLGKKTRTVLLEALQGNDLWISNWRQILPYLASNRQFIETRQFDRILKLCEAPRMLVDIERAELPGDPTITRTAVFELVRRGQLIAEDLHSHPLRPSSRFFKATTHGAVGN